LNAVHKAPLFGPRFVQLIATALILVFLLIHSQTFSGFFDESFHMIAAQLINQGRWPYADFFYQHTPLFPMIAALWMKVFGDTWRSLHVLSTLLAGGCVYHVTDYVRRTIPDNGWRNSAIAVTAVLFGLNTLTVRFATIAQPYALCLILIVASFTFAVRSADSKSRTPIFLAGVCAGGAVCSSLLTLPVVPIELAWIVFQAPDSRSRVKQTLQFTAGVVIALVPFLVLFLHAPAATFFDTVRYHAAYRGWASAAEARHHEVDVLSSWIDSGQALVLLLLASIGALSIVSRSLWTDRLRKELLLCVLLVLGFAVFSSIPYPTFDQYYVFAIPFLAILSAAGMYAIGVRTSTTNRHTLIAAAICAVYFLGLGSSVRRNPNFYAEKYWPGLDRIADEVNRVTPAGQAVYSDDANLYVASHRLPPSGVENVYAPDARISAQHAAALHVMLLPEIKTAVESGEFASVVTCITLHRLDTARMQQLFANREDFRDQRCSLFWGRPAVH
jgi:hypothetical protein